MNPEWKRSVCPFDCPDACGLLVNVQKNQAVAVQGDPAHPFTRGVLCPKMVHYEHTVHSPDRLRKPLLRVGPKGSQDFQEIPWDEAVARIVERWKAIIDKYGAEAILPASYAGTLGMLQRNAGHAFFHRLGASRLDRTLCSSAKDHGWKAVMGATCPPQPDEVSKSDFIILWGSHTLASNIHFLHGVREAKKEGAKVWVIETHRSATADAVADRLITVTPGTDGVLALAMMHVLVREKLVDRAFVERHVLGFERLETEVLPKYSPTAAEKITGVPAAVIEELAQAFGKATAPFIRQGSGIYRYGNGAMTARIITSLPAVVGAWAKPGGGTVGDIPTGAAFAMGKITREDFIRQPTRIININQLGDALNNVDKPPVMSLYVYHSNPASVYPDQNSIIRGLLREDIFTVVHERFLTDTTMYADIVLPATSSLEHADVYRSYGHYGVQKVSAVIPPVGEARSNWDTFQTLAVAMGFEEPFFRQSEEEVISEYLAEPGPWLAGIDPVKLREGVPTTLPLAENYKMDFRTASGKIEIVNAAEPKAVPDWFEPYGGKEAFWLLTVPSLYSLNSSFNEQTELVAKKGPMSVAMNPKDADEKNLKDGHRVVLSNELGAVTFVLKVTDRIPCGVLVADGVSWLRDAPGDRTINALTSQRLTDRGNGSTFYDTKVDIRPE